MAPELLEDTSNLKYSEQSDIYALGMRIALSDILGKITREDESSSVENLPKPLNSGIKEQSYEDKQGDLLNTHQYSLSIQLGTPPRRNYKVTNNEGDNQESLTTTDTSTSSNKGLNRQKQDNLQEQIMSKSLALEKLVDSAKEKLKSDSRFNFKRKKRNEKLKKTFEVLPATSKELVKKIENIKKNLSKKLTKEEINNLCQISRELRELHLSTQSEQKSQVQIPPK
ncbi:10720_t:CDS:2 [Paraglomus occultum]|uniref:10720_t:CDS:1 n=1 Tax=Paraglomus occultum TaxID=144539 RepID=A0A9N9A6X4_9GLOM|nr:10720_t:CDS:2 [Paraglomus occultum]